MTDYLEVISITPLRVQRKSRPSLSKMSEPAKTRLKEDYKSKTGIEVKSPKKQGLSQDHRFSDADIQDNIISDINSDFETHYTSNLIENVFPWEPDEDEKNKAKRLLVLLQRSTDVTVKLQSANSLIELMSLHSENLSYGNASQNSAIGRHLDLNAPQDVNRRHSLSPRSRKITTELYIHKADVLFSPPKSKLRNTFFSSQYGTGGKKNKEQKNINILKSTPRTERLLQQVQSSNAEYQCAQDFFKDHFGMSCIQAMTKLPHDRLVSLHKNFKDILEETDTSADDFFETSLEKFALMSDDALHNLMRETFCEWNDLSSLSIRKLEHIKSHAERIYEVIENYDIKFSEITELSSDELTVFMDCDLDLHKAIFENGYSFANLVKLYRLDPLHLTCLTSDLYDLVLDHAPNIPEIMLEYAEEFDVDLEEISDNLCKSDRLLMTWNHGITCR